MSETARMVDAARAPTAAAVKRWIGGANAKRWDALRAFIDHRYPHVFDVEWLFGGTKGGWALRFKKSKSFCTFIPERGRFRVLVVFGAEEQEKMKAVLPGLVSHVRQDYQQSKAHHDGRWLFTNVDGAPALKDVKRLLELKRKPKA